MDGGLGREQYINEVLHAAQADIILLQEVFYADLVRDLAMSLKMDWFVAIGNSRRHLALLSRFPILSIHNYQPFPPIHRTLLEANIQVADKHLYIFGVHLLAHYSIPCECWRVWEVKTILNRIKLRESEPCLVMGDFNTIAPLDRVVIEAMPSFLKLMILLQGGRVFRFAIRKMLSAGFVDCFRSLHPHEDGFTLPPPNPNARLDYIFANQMIKDFLKACLVVHEPLSVRMASDHFPVIAEFDF